MEVRQTGNRWEELRKQRGQHVGLVKGAKSVVTGGPWLFLITRLHWGWLGGEVSGEHVRLNRESLTLCSRHLNLNLNLIQTAPWNSRASSGCPRNREEDQPKGGGPSPTRSQVAKLCFH